MATATTTAAVQAASAASGSCGAGIASNAISAIAASRDQGVTRQTTALNAACPARKSAAPPRIIQIVDAAGRPAGWESTFWSAAAVTMIPAIMTGWME